MKRILSILLTIALLASLTFAFAEDATPSESGGNTNPSSETSDNGGSTGGSKTPVDPPAGDKTPAPEATETPAPQATETPAPEATETPAPEATETPAPEATETPEPEATETPAPEATETPEPEATETPEPEATETPEPEATETPEPEATETPEPSPTPVRTPRPTKEPEYEPLDLSLLFDVVYDFEEDAVTVEANGYSIPATVTIPTAATLGQTFPCVIMINGYGTDSHGTGNGYDLFAEELARNGFASIRYDMKGTGASTEDGSNFAFADAMEEAMLCYDYMSAKSEQINGMAMCIMGWNMGGSLALATAAENDMFDAVVSWASPLYDGNIGDDQSAEAAANSYYASMLGLDISSMIPSAVAPILAISASDDIEAPAQTADSIVAASLNENSAAHCITGADANFNILSGDQTKFDELMETTIDWLKKTL